MMVVPGPVTSAMSVGCHALLRREDYDALLVESIADVLAVVAGASLAQVPDNTVSTEQSPLDLLEPMARRVFDGLAARGWRTESEIAGRCAIPVTDVLRALPALQLAGLAEAGELGYRINPQTRR